MQQQMQQPQQVPPHILNNMMNYEKKNNELKLENDMLKDKVKYLEEKMGKVIKEMIELKMMYNK
jgi:cell division protein FtsB